MAPGQMYGVLAVILTILPSLALATDYLVGDKKGWTPNVNYTKWAADKVFKVGDRLVFQYPADQNNVYQVTSATAFRDCEVPLWGTTFTTGHDVVPLETSGNKWYISGKANYCSELRQKLRITVMEPDHSPAPSPNNGSTPIPNTPSAPTPSSANVMLASGYHAFVAVMAVIALMVMV